MDPVEKVTMIDALLLLRNDTINLFNHLNTNGYDDEKWWTELGNRLIVLELWRKMLFSIEGEVVGKGDNGNGVQETPGVQGEETTSDVVSNVLDDLV